MSKKSIWSGRRGRIDGKIILLQQTFVASHLNANFVFTTVSGGH